MDQLNRHKKSIWQNLIPIHDKNSQIENRRKLPLSMIKNTYKNPTTIIIINGEGLNAFPLRSGRKGCPFSLLLLDTILEVLATTINQEKKN